MGVSTGREPAGEGLTSVGITWGDAPRRVKDWCFSRCDGTGSQTALTCPPTDPPNPGRSEAGRRAGAPALSSSAL